MHVVRGTPVPTRAIRRMRRAALRVAICRVLRSSSFAAGSAEAEFVKEIARRELGEVGLVGILGRSVGVVRAVTWAAA